MRERWRFWSKKCICLRTTCILELIWTMIPQLRIASLKDLVVFGPGQDSRKKQEFYLSSKRFICQPSKNLSSLVHPKPMPETSAEEVEDFLWVGWSSCATRPGRRQSTRLRYMYGGSQEESYSSTVTPSRSFILIDLAQSVPGPLPLRLPGMFHLVVSSPHRVMTRIGQCLIEEGDHRLLIVLRLYISQQIKY